MVTKSASDDEGVVMLCFGRNPTLVAMNLGRDRVDGTSLPIVSSG